MEDKGYSGINLPNNLIDEIDNFLKETTLGYKSRAEIVKVAVREFLAKHNIPQPNSKGNMPPTANNERAGVSIKKEVDNLDESERE